MMLGTFSAFAGVLVVIASLFVFAVCRSEDSYKAQGPAWAQGLVVGIVATVVALLPYVLR